MLPLENMPNESTSSLKMLLFPSCLLKPPEEVKYLYRRSVLLLSNIVSQNDIFPIATLFGLELYLKKTQTKMISI